MKSAWPVSIGVLFPVAYAAFSFSVKSIDKQSLAQKEEEVKVTLAINELPSESYFRVAFQPKDGGAYFGYIKNDKSEWVKIGTLSGDCQNYYHLTDTSANELTISLIIGGENEIENGDYLIKGHRYTAGCSYKEGETAV